MLLCTGNRIKRDERFSVAYAIGFFQRLCGRCEHRGAHMPITLRERTCAFLYGTVDARQRIESQTHRGMSAQAPSETRWYRASAPSAVILRTGVFFVFG